MKSQRQIAFERFRFSDPSYIAKVIPVGGEERVAVAMVRENSSMKRVEYGQVLATYRSRKTAEKLAVDLMDFRSRMLSKAYP